MFDEAIQKALDEDGDLDTAIEMAAKPKVRMLEIALTRTPFGPFRISLTSGSTHDINHPEEIIVGSMTASLRRRARGAGVYEQWAVLSLIHVVSIEFSCVDQPTIVAATTKE